MIMEGCFRVIRRLTVIRAAGIVLLGVLIASGNSLAGSFWHNSGCIRLLKGIMPARFDAGMLLSSVQCFDWVNKSASHAHAQRYAPAIALIATLDPMRESPRQEEIAQAAFGRRPSFQKAALLIALRKSLLAHEEGQAEREKAWRILAAELQPGSADARKSLSVWLASCAGDIKGALGQYEAAIAIQKPGWEDYLRMEALNLKLGRDDVAAHWHKKLCGAFPERQYAWLHDYRNPFVQHSLSEAFGYFKLYHDAIAYCRGALARNDWDWGRRILAGFYEATRQYEDAERQMEAAIVMASSPGLALRYRVELADLHVRMGKLSQAVSEYRQALLLEESATSALDDEWRNHARDCLKKLVGESQIPKGKSQ